MKSNLKGQLGNLQGIILVIVVVGILLGAGFFILGEFQNQLDDNIFSVLNETTASFNLSGYTVDRATSPGFHSFSVSEARNGSSGLVINAGNFTVNSITGVVTNATSVEWNVVHLDYSFLGGSDAFTGVDNTVTALLTVPDLLPLIALIAMVIIIIALVFTIPGVRGIKGA